jgi:hypothetical protein
MKQLLILTGVIILSSCSTAWHYNKIERKDPNFWTQFSDTIKMPFVTYDTIFHNGDTIAIIQRIEYRDTVVQVRTIAPRTRHDRKAEANQLRYELKMEREQTKQAKHENKTLRVQARTERTQTRVEGRNKRTEARTQRRGARTFLLCLISFVVGCLVGMGFMFQHKSKVLRWLIGF